MRSVGFFGGLLLTVMLVSQAWGGDPALRAFKPPVGAPGFRLPSLDGKMVELSDYRGRGVLLVFWATT